MTSTNETSARGADAKERYDAFKAQGLKLNMQRGQPSDADFDLSNKMLSVLGTQDYTTPSGLDTRNYPGGVNGIPEARALFAEYLDIDASEVLVWNNASLEVQTHVLTLALLRGLKGSAGPWVAQKPKMIVTTPGYDRHFLLLETLGFELEAVDMQHDGPDVDAVERLAADERVKGILFVPTYSNPGGETISEEKAKRLANLSAAAPDFTIFADDAYRAHHLHDDDRDTPVNFVRLCEQAGRPDRAFVFASTSKITFAGAGLGFVGSSAANIKLLGGYLGAISIGPNKVEQLRHVQFLRSYPGGLEGLMRDHARLIAPKFAAVEDVLRRELGGSGLATWTTPKGGYFISLDTALPIASRVVELADAAGVSLTPAGATYPRSADPKNANIRLAPTRPTLEDVKAAMEVVAVCVRVASEEYRA
ncbi:aminotransferase class I/II-fold pyridoxal phosphate-dependent enzyme [Deinococcus yavapaiensis]|uniref:aminotransferase class I/II-fold pyridoxal phosphate-dependent enzyme n=1 Tax=Deinococcus yavapaiensis TaxID=309889 RepID=UPI001FE4B643|nr:aminotransferase class I/II-fold pyridoxal phosphate-dependent enzyme [Deinococcus yavapaiensis]